MSLQIKKNKIKTLAQLQVLRRHKPSTSRRKLPKHLLSATAQGPAQQLPSNSQIKAWLTNQKDSPSSLLLPTCSLPILHVVPAGFFLPFSFPLSSSLCPSLSPVLGLYPLLQAPNKLPFISDLSHGLIVQGGHFGRVACQGPTSVTGVSFPSFREHWSWDPRPLPACDDQMSLPHWLLHFSTH